MTKRRERQVQDMSDRELWDLDVQVGQEIRRRKDAQGVAKARACEHQWVYHCTSSHGSDKGHSFYRCPKCDCWMEERPQYGSEPHVEITYGSQVIS